MVLWRWNGMECFSILALNPMNSMKRQKYRTLQDELPRSIGDQLPNILLEISGEITPERMKRQSQSKNNTQLWM